MINDCSQSKRKWRRKYSIFIHFDTSNLVKHLKATNKDFCLPLKKRLCKKLSTHNAMQVKQTGLTYRVVLNHQVLMRNYDHETFTQSKVAHVAKIVIKSECVNLNMQVYFSWPPYLNYGNVP